MRQGSCRLSNRNAACISVGMSCLFAVGMKERVNAEAMKRKFGGVGLGYEDQPGAMLLDVWGEPMWKQDAGRWLNRRSRGREAVRDGPD